ncbi:adenosylcobalamin-dependent ribonucleoside-diphosphate reductase [archaeon]|jgi:ribonucleoside-diphosphate reductase alpha chain|nr:adenosylcobalamin-dependent ribonucleoside-diphosphate reductase [archaeon]MBT6823828.1 adenosylcobalamin-dependent ribonucleoside-diphosphate reductase [archaeon]MBT7107137.1 adenosylcobalamin-dependent ribonucleoside-diphosphate reductase [archaeon]MBT7297247.1 adenosylcobalamin-dependent ribonucleoside-diphosphate reductase [archaeon]
MKLPNYVNQDNLEERLSDNSKWTLEQKYLKRNGEGKIVEGPKERLYTIANTIATIDSSYGHSEEEIGKVTENFYNAMTNLNFLPAGRVFTNAGTETKALFNCYVLDPEDSIDPDDDLNDIFGEVRKGARIHKEGGGTGYNFSKLRPRGSYVKKSKGVASGPISFMEQFDKATEIINSGNRRGANMGILDVNHPDIMDFIYAKAVHEKLKNFNISIGATDKFMDATINDGYFPLEFKGNPLTLDDLLNYQSNIEENKLGGSEIGKAPNPPSLIVDKEKGRVLDSYTNQDIGRINEENNVELYGPAVMDIIANLAWQTADPGMIFLDAINRENPLPNKGPIKATNPCGEQPLHPYDACNLGSLNLSNMVKKLEDGYEVDWDKLNETTQTAVHFMDNVNDASKGPIKEIEDTVLEHRRIGLGVMGWADMLLKLKVPYDSKEAVELAEQVMSSINNTAKEKSVQLAEQRGVFPAFEGSIYDTGDLEDRVRNVARTTIAPTGSIAMVAGVSGGIEPYFSNIFYKNIRGGERLKFVNPELERALKDNGIYSEKLLDKIEKNGGSLKGIKEIPKELQEIFKVAGDIHSKDHIRVQAAFQRNLDNAVSKTINMPNNATVDDVKEAYLLAYQMGLKGTTIYRDGSKDVQVLETNKEEETERTYITPRKIPDMMPSVKIKQHTPFGHMHVNITVDPKDGAPYEVFAQLGKSGDVVHADLEGICRQLSTNLRAGVDPNYCVDQLEGIGASIASIPTREGVVTSIPDGVGRALKKYLMAIENYGFENLLLGNVDYDEIVDELSDTLKKGNGNSSTNSNEDQKNTYGIKCPKCEGGKLIFQEGCKRCSSCDYSAC